MINFYSKTLYVVLFMVLLSLFTFGAYAYDVGHDISRVSPPSGCDSGQILRLDIEDGTSWECIDIPTTNPWSLAVDGSNTNQLIYPGRVAVGYSDSGSYNLAVNGNFYSSEGIILSKVTNDQLACDDASVAGVILYIPPTCDNYYLSDSTTLTSYHTFIVGCMQKGPDDYGWEVIDKYNIGVSCGDYSCIPITSTSCSSGLCGVYSDGCGGQIDCGTCLSGEYCSTEGICRADEYVDPAEYVDPNYVPGGDAYYGACFLPGTQVIMSDGASKNIEDVKEGEIVLSFDENKNKFVKSIVNELIIHTKANTPEWQNGYYILKTANGNELNVTGNHPVYSIQNGKYGYYRVDSLNVGNNLLTITGEKYGWATIESLEFIEINLEKVYNLELEDNPHNYFAENILVHNLKMPPCVNRNDVGLCLD